MTPDQPSAPPSADQGLDRVDRGQRVIGETTIGDCHDGKERAHFARRIEGVQLASDVHGKPGETRKTATVEDVVEVADSASAWEALEPDGDD